MRLLFPLWIASLALGCRRPPDEELPAFEIEARAELSETPIRLDGLVRAELGPVAGATVACQGVEATTDAEGRFELVLARENALVRVEASGFHIARRGVQLVRPVGEAAAAELVVDLTPSTATRMLFAGDTMFGRRFLDPEDATPLDEIPEAHEDAWIRAETAGEDTRVLFDPIRPLFHDVDFAGLNLETPIVGDPRTPYQGKPYVYFSLPGSLPAVAELGIDWVGLANNHLYDYLEPGVVDTLDHLDAAGLPASGAGVDAEQAWTPRVISLRGEDYSLVAASSIAGDQYDVGFLATETRGGAADVGDTARLTRTIEDAVAAGQLPIFQLHTGVEYALSPRAYAIDRLERASEAGAVLGVAHHSHTAQGFGWHGGMLAAHSLGNFVFDQDRLETMLGVMLRADLRDGEVVAATGVPVYLEDYRPRPVVGRLAERLVQRLAEVSTPHGATVAAIAGEARIAIASAPVETRILRLDVAVDEGMVVVDLEEHLHPGEYVQSASSPAHELALGRDILLYGNAEDEDVDEDLLEVARWDVRAPSVFPCVAHAYRGAAGFCSVRSDVHADDSVLPLRNRLRAPGEPENAPVKELTLFGYSRGEGARDAVIRYRVYASEGERTFGEGVLVELGSGDWDWRAFVADFELPADQADVEDRENNPRAVRFFVHHPPPVLGESLLAVDELAVIHWQPAASTLSTDGPHPAAFLRVEGASGSAAVELTVARVASAW